jgi:hypothetical protein
MKVSCRISAQLLFFALFAFQFTTANANTGAAFKIRGAAAINDTVLTLDTVIKEGDVIKTGKNSSVKIIMQDRTVLDISENTTFKIQTYKYERKDPDRSDASSTFNLVKGTFRYISGLIAKRRYQNVNIVTGGATLGIRGSFDTFSFDGTTISVDTSIGEAFITLPSGETLTIAEGNTGTFNVSSGESTVTPTTTPDSVSQAVTDIASDPEDPGNVNDAISGLNDPDTAMAMAALINNREQLGIDDEDIYSILGNIVAARPSLAVALAYVASALDPENSQAFIDTIIEAAPVQADAIQEAGELGTELAPAPDTIDTGATGAGEGLDSGLGGAGGGGGGTASPN